MLLPAPVAHRIAQTSFEIRAFWTKTTASTREFVPHCAFFATSSLATGSFDIKIPAEKIKLTPLFVSYE
jgi:hypothetical protein